MSTKQQLMESMEVKAAAMRREADARVNDLTQQMEQRLDEARRVHGAQVTVLTAHYDSLVRNPAPSH